MTYIHMDMCVCICLCYVYNYISIINIYLQTHIMDTHNMCVLYLYTHIYLGIQVYVDVFTMGEYFYWDL